MVEHAPRKLDHDVTDTCAAGFHQTAVTTPAAALIGRSSEADKPRQCPAIGEATHEHLGDKRGGRRGPHTRDSHKLLKQPSGLGRKIVFTRDPHILGGVAPISGLDHLDLFLDEREPFEQSLELGARIRRQRLALGGAELGKLATGCRCIWIDFTQPMHRQQRPDPVPQARPLRDELGTLAARAP